MNIVCFYLKIEMSSSKNYHCQHLVSLVLQRVLSVKKTFILVLKKRDKNNRMLQDGLTYCYITFTPTIGTGNNYFISRITTLTD